MAADVGLQKWLDKARSSTASSTIYTPSCDSTVPGETAEAPRYGPLQPNKTFKVIERLSGRAITLDGDFLGLVDPAEKGPHATNEWFCVESNGYLGLQDFVSGRYIGHNGKQRVHARAVKHQSWECITTRDHPRGGYWLLTPEGEGALRYIVVAGDGKSLATRHHGKTLWDFVEVSEP